MSITRLVSDMIQWKSANFICSDPTLLAEQTGSQDVVEDHHRRNRFPRAPDPARLRQVQQPGSSAPLEQDASPDGAELDDSVPDTLKDVVNSGELSGPPTRLRSYPFKFREIIERAKQLAQCGAITTPFPNRADFVDEKSAIYIAEAIAEREEKGVVIPPGKCDVTMLNKLLAKDGQDTGQIIAKILAY